MANPPRSRTVFVDTGLDTRMVMEVQEGDTFADFKRKIEHEHTLCYPEIGEIGVNALKVKHKGVFYHLSNSMHVKSAFDEAKRKWFVWADAYRLGERGLEIAGHLPEVHERLNEAAVILQNVASLSGREDGNAGADALLNVREDLETEFDHMGYDHCRTSSSDTNKRVVSKVDGDYSKNGASGQIRQLGEKRKIDDSQNPVGNVSKVDFSGIQEANFPRKKRKIEKKGKDSAKQINRNTDNSTTVLSDQGAQDAVTCEQVNVTTSGANSTAVGVLCDFKPPVDARLESTNKPTNEDPVEDHSHLNLLHIAVTNVLTNVGDTVRQDPANEGSLTAKSTIDGEHFSGLTTAAYKSEVPAKKSKRSTQQKKKKTKSKTLQNHLATEVSVMVPMGNNGVENVKASTDLQATDAAEKENIKTSAMQNTGEALNNPNQLPANQISLIDQNALLPTAKPLNVSEAPEVLHIDEGSMSSKTRKTWRKTKDGECHKKRITILGNESVTTQVDIVSNLNAESLSPQLERSNMSRSGLNGKNREVAGFDAVNRDTNGSSAKNDVIGSEGSEMPVVKEKEPNPKASQLNASSEIKNHVPASRKGNRKLKWKRPSATGPEIQLQDKLADPSQSSGDINSEDKSVVADKKEMRTAANNDGKKSTSSSNDAAHASQVEGKLPESAVGNNPLVDDSVKDKILCSATEEINFNDYFVPNQDKPGAVASVDAGDVIKKRITVNEKTKDPDLKEISAVVKDGKKYQVESSQDSLSVRLPQGAVLHSDTESFRVPTDRSLSSSGKQMLKISSKKFKQTTSETKSLHSPSASETRKSTSSHGATKQNKIQSKAKAVTASNSSMRSLRGVHQTKSKQLATNKVVNADSSASRRKTLLSTNIFKDDYDESSEDEAVSSGHSAGTYMDDSDVSEMEGDTGFATPITVGQRKAAEVDKDSSMNNYTLEKLRESAHLGKLKRAQELGIPLEEFVPDSQIDLD